MSHDDVVLLGVMEASEAERLRTNLSAKGVDVVFNHNEQTCTTGCATTVEVHANSRDIPTITQYFQDEKARLLEGHDFDENQVNEIFDPSKEEATCPACGTKFSTTSNECPDCGLVF